MEKLRKTEIIILTVLWSLSLSTYSIALTNNYILYPSDYLGLLGLTIVSLIAYFKPHYSFQGVLILLLVGLFNLISFIYFFNIVMTFGFSVIVSPGIQLISLVLLSVLVIRKRDEVGRFYQLVFAKTQEDNDHSKKISQARFKTKFNQYSDEEIENKLQQDLVPEATSALNEIKAERKNGRQ